MKATIIFLLSICVLSACEKRKPNWGLALEQQDINVERIEHLQSATGLEAQIINFYQHWPAPRAIQDFPLDTLSVIKQLNALPCITWEPLYVRNNKEFAVLEAEILTGQYDAYIDTFALNIKKFGAPVIIRFAHEMNISRYHWGTNLKDYGAKSPEIYKKLFRYVVSKFRHWSVKNAYFAFSPNAESVPNTSYDNTASWNKVSAYYPGDEYVDILGMDGYNWGTTQTKEKSGWDSHWKTAREIFEPLHNELRSLSKKKPMLVMETASVGDAQKQRAWLQQALETFSAWDVKAIIWFEVNKEVDWRLQFKADQELASGLSNNVTPYERYREHLN